MTLTDKRNDVPAIYNDWFFMPESEREEYLSMSASLLINTQVFAGTTDLDLFGFAFDMWNHKMETKAKDFLVFLSKRKENEAVHKAQEQFEKAIKRSITEKKLRSFSEFVSNIIKF